MEIFDAQKQAKGIIDSSQRILVTCNKNLDGDSIGASFALFLLLKKMGKDAKLIFDKDAPAQFQFLPKAEFSAGAAETSRNLTISLDLSHKQVGEVLYEKNGDDLQIIITPKNDCVIREKDLQIKNSGADYDLVIVLSSPDLDSLGEIFGKNPGMFREGHILNIDWRKENGGFGEINLVDPSASSTSETLADLMKSYYENFLDRDVATCLLTGIIVNTKNFQAPLCSPKTLFLASYLMEKGGEQQKIIRYLYKEKGLGQLKLFGRILARLKGKEGRDFTMVMVPYEDFVLTETRVPNLATVIEEFKETAPGLNPLVLIWENEKKEVWGVILCQNMLKIKDFEQKIGGVIKGDKLFFRPNAATLKDAGEEILNLI